MTAQRSRHLFVVGLLVLIALTAAVGFVACGDEPSPPPRPAASAASTAFTGYWFESDMSTKPVHIITDGGTITMAPDSPLEASGPLQVKGDLLVVPLGEASRLELRRSTSGKKLSGTLFSNQLRTGDVNDVAVFRISYDRGDETQLHDYEAEQAKSVLTRGVNAWQEKTGAFPPVDQVRPGTEFADLLVQWPVNPYTGKPVKTGNDPGDYKYWITKRGWYALRMTTSNGGTTSSGSLPK